MGLGVGQHPEGQGQEGVSGEHRGGLVELTVGRRPAPAQIVVVHAGQVVVHQRIGVQHLDRSGGAQRALFRHAEQGRALQGQEGPQPLAAREDGVAHGLTDAGLVPLRRRQQPLQNGVGPRGLALHRLVQGCKDGVGRAGLEGRARHLEATPRARASGRPSRPRSGGRAVPPVRRCARPSAGCPSCGLACRRHRPCRRPCRRR